MLDHCQAVPVRAAPRGRPAPAKSNANLSALRPIARGSVIALAELGVPIRLGSGACAMAIEVGGVIIPPNRATFAQ